MTVDTVMAVLVGGGFGAAAYLVVVAPFEHNRLGWPPWLLRIALLAFMVAGFMPGAATRSPEAWLGVGITAVLGFVAMHVGLRIRVRHELRLLAEAEALAGAPSEPGEAAHDDVDGRDADRASRTDGELKDAGLGG